LGVGKILSLLGWGRKLDYKRMSSAILDACKKEETLKNVIFSY
jgi:hypothetical protein